MMTLAQTGWHKMAALKALFMTTLRQSGGHKMAVLKVMFSSLKTSITNKQKQKWSDEPMSV